MSRYHFHVRDRWGEADDPDGLDLPDLDAARAEAVAGARSLLADGVRHGVLDLRARIEVTDSRGHPVLSLTFAEAVAVPPYALEAGPSA